MTRIVAERLSGRLDQQIVVDARSGASGTLAAAQVAHAAADGYTLIILPGAHATTAAFYNKLPYRPIDDFSMIGMTTLGRPGSVKLAVEPSSMSAVYLTVKALSSS